MKAWFRKLFGFGASHKPSAQEQPQEPEPEVLEEFVVGKNVTQDELNAQVSRDIQRYHFYQSMLKDAELAILELEDKRNADIKQRTFSPDEYGTTLLHIREIEEFAARFSQEHLSRLQRSHDGRKTLTQWRRSATSVELASGWAVELPSPYTGCTDFVSTGEAPKQIQQPNGVVQETRGLFRITAQQDDGSFVLENVQQQKKQ